MNVQSVSNKTRAPRPPEKGAFPLDHFGDCEEPKLRYQQCLDANSLTSRHCRDIAKEYITCRMDRGLMKPEELRNLGLTVPVPDPPKTQVKKEELGFVAGRERVTKTN